MRKTFLTTKTPLNSISIKTLKYYSYDLDNFYKNYNNNNHSTFMMTNIRNEMEALYGTEPTVSAPSNDVTFASDLSLYFYIIYYLIS